MTTYNQVDINGYEVSYREAGPKDAPTIVLLHGFPSSSHMFRELIPRLADRFDVVAPDYIGFGYSAHPPAAEFKYTFAGAKAFLQDIPNAELHLLDTGHFALEEESELIADRIRDFLGSGIRKAVSQ